MRVQPLCRRNQLSRFPDIRRLFCLLFALCGVSIARPAVAQQEFIVELRNGMQLGPGTVSDTDSISSKSNERVNTGNAVSRSILILDDGLRNTYVNKSIRNVIANRLSTMPAFEHIELPSAGEAARSGNAPSIVGQLGISSFNKYGRRTYSLMTTRGRVDVLQGITVLTPLFAKVEVLRTGHDDFAWDQRIATTSIPAQELRDILYQAVDLDKSSDWLRLVSFYQQAKRYAEAHAVMSEALVKFPVELGDRAPVLTQLNQLFANQQFEEIKLRKKAGQYQLVGDLLGQFPLDALSGENQLKLDAEIKMVQQQVLLITDIVASLKEHVAKLPEPEQQAVLPLVQEMSDEISFDSAARLDDFQRLRRDPTIDSESLVAYALGGWLLGSGAGLDNLAVAKSALRVRTLTQRYLTVGTQAERQQILEELRGEEGARPELLAKVIQSMQPPLPPPQPSPDDPPGLLRLKIEGSDGSLLDYVVQLPPEYDPNRRYPCVLALTGKGFSPELEVDWWCGLNLELPVGEYRFGQATRYGYIVVSPNWMTAEQGDYEYTEGEHARILACLRDAYRHFSIDTDRVFVTGHFAGATAAWDLAVAHPDLWAGAILISPGADKYIFHYLENISASARNPDQIPLGTYLVYGELDGTRSVSMMGSVATRQLNPNSTILYDALVVEYHGEGRVRFSSELPRIIEWMELSSHRRIRAKQNIEVRSMRQGDRFFYWLEAPSISADLVGNPYQFDPKRFAQFDARILDSTANGVSVNKIPSPDNKAIVWLTPEMVDFSRPMTFISSGRKSVQTLEPSIEVMLEDVRQRGDRQLFFWQRVIL
ncbi:MAG: alpha/beta hydrolase-fold protein [Pirellulaceae bacterium]